MKQKEMLRENSQNSLALAMGCFKLIQAGADFAQRKIDKSERFNSQVVKADRFFLQAQSFVQFVDGNSRISH